MILKWLGIVPSDYSPVGNEDTPMKTEDGFQRSPPTSSRCGRWMSFFLVLQFALIALLLASLHILANRKPSDIVCARQLSPYSPYLESDDLVFDEYTEQNHLMQPSPYRGHPTPEVEEAWIRLWRLPYIGFPEARMADLNKTNPEDYARVPPPHEDNMLGFLNVFHQLHCLNMVRQYTYRDEYDYSTVTAFRAPPELVRGHVDHCIETIRKSLMCVADVTPNVFQLDESRAVGYKSDFNLRRKCKNFDRIQDWAIANAVQLNFD